jgi:uncharacterized membrane protein YhaH (DUF805 family)
MKLKFINLYTADYVLTYIRGGLYLLLGTLAVLSYIYKELHDIHRANQFIQHIVRLEPMLLLAFLAWLAAILTFIVALGFMSKRASDLKYSESLFHAIALMTVFAVTTFLLLAAPTGEDMAVRSLIRRFCTHIIQVMVFAELVRLLGINSFLKRSLLKAQEKA